MTESGRPVAFHEPFWFAVAGVPPGYAHRAVSGRLLCDLRLEQLAEL